MNEFGIVSLVMGIGFLIFAIWVKPTKTHHHSAK